MVDFYLNHMRTNIWILPLLDLKLYMVHTIKIKYKTIA